MKEILAKIIKILCRFSISFVCLFKLTFRLGDKEGKTKLPKEDKHNG